jgi:dihydroorotate dehydrogenase
VDIIGAGGISSANDVRDYLAAGAKAIQIATALVEHGPAVFEKILFESNKKSFG